MLSQYTMTISLHDFL